MEREEGKGELKQPLRRSVPTINKTLIATMSFDPRTGRILHMPAA